MMSYINVQLLRGLPITENWTRYYHPNKWEVKLGVPERVNIPCLMDGTRLCKKDVKITTILYHHM